LISRLPDRKGAAGLSRMSSSTLP